MQHLLNKLKPLLPDLFLVTGAASVSYGVWAAYPPAGYVVAGGFVIFAGLKLA